MTAKRPDQTLPFRLYMSDSASLDLPTDAGESTPGQTILPFQVPRLAMLTRPTQWVLCSCRASARASQPDLTVFILRSARLTRSTQWVLGSRRVSATVLATHLMFRPTGGEAQPSAAAGLVRPPNTVQLSLLSSHLFPPPGEAYPFDVLSLDLPSESARAKPVPGFLFSLLAGEAIRLTS